MASPFLWTILTSKVILTSLFTPMRDSRCRATDDASTCQRIVASLAKLLSCVMIALVSFMQFIMGVRSFLLLYQVAIHIPYPAGNEIKAPIFGSRPDTL